MDDLRERLHRAAGPSPEPLDFPGLKSRVRRGQVIRGGVTVAAVAAILAVSASVMDTAPQPPTVTDAPPPDIARSVCEDPEGDFRVLDATRPVQLDPPDLEQASLTRTRGGDLQLSFETVATLTADISDKLEETAARQTDSARYDVYLRSLDDPGLTGHVRFEESDDLNAAGGYRIAVGTDATSLEPVDVERTSIMNFERVSFVIPAASLAVLGHPLEWAATWRYLDKNAVDLCPNTITLEEPLGVSSLPTLPAPR